MQACKPGFVPSDKPPGSYHLSSPNITTGIKRSTRPAHYVERAILPPSVARILEKQDLFDLSTHKVYPASGITTQAVSSYPTFSPLPAFTKVSAGEAQRGACPTKPSRRRRAVFFLYHNFHSFRFTSFGLNLKLFLFLIDNP